VDLSVRPSAFAAPSDCADRGRPLAPSDRWSETGKSARPTADLVEDRSMAKSIAKSVGSEENSALTIFLEKSCCISLGKVYFEAMVFG
jgi:hypothetical protein